MDNRTAQKVCACSYDREYNAEVVSVVGCHYPTEKGAQRREIRENDGGAVPLPRRRAFRFRRR